jgi:hypothetical protein
VDANRIKLIAQHCVLLLLVNASFPLSPLDKNLSQELTHLLLPSLTCGSEVVQVAPQSALTQAPGGACNPAAHGHDMEPG